MVFNPHHLHHMMESRGYSSQIWVIKPAGPAHSVTSLVSDWSAVVEEERLKHKLECVRVCSVFAVCGRLAATSDDQGRNDDNLLTAARFFWVKAFYYLF